MEIRVGSILSFAPGGENASAAVLVFAGQNWVPGLWVAIASTGLPFSSNLIGGRLCTPPLLLTADDTTETTLVEYAVSSDAVNFRVIAQVPTDNRADTQVGFRLFQGYSFSFMEPIPLAYGTPIYCRVTNSSASNNAFSVRICVQVTNVQPSMTFNNYTGHFDVGSGMSSTQPVR